MRDKNPSSFEPTLGNCLMDSDPEVLRLMRRNRRRSLMLSSLIQAALLTAAIVLPLFASQTIPAFRSEPRLPGFKGIRIVDPHPAGNHGPRQTVDPPRKWNVVIAPPTVPTGVVRVDDRDQGGRPDTTPGLTGCAVCDPNGIPGLDPNVFSSLRHVPPAPKAPAPDPRPRYVRVSQPVQEAKLIHRVTPVYPPLMRQIRKSGRVELRAVIGRDGTISELTLINGDPGFILAAQQAVLQWRYAPTLLNGEPMEVETRITVIFTMTNN